MKKDKGSLYLDSISGLIILSILLHYFINFFISNIKINKLVFKKNLAIEDLSNISEKVKAGKYEDLIKELLDKSKIQVKTRNKLDLEMTIIKKIEDLYIIELKLKYEDPRFVRWVIPVVEGG